MGIGGSSYSGSYAQNRRQRNKRPIHPKPGYFETKEPARAPPYAPPSPTSSEAPPAYTSTVSLVPRTEAHGGRPGEKGRGGVGGVRVREREYGMAGQGGSLEGRSRAGRDGDRLRAGGSEAGTSRVAETDVPESEASERKGWLKSAVGGVTSFWK